MFNIDYRYGLFDRFRREKKAEEPEIKIEKQSVNEEKQREKDEFDREIQLEEM